MPVWRDRSFTGLFADCYIEDTELEGGFIAPSLAVVAKVLGVIVMDIKADEPEWLADLDQKEMAALRRVTEIFAASARLAQDYPSQSGSASKLSAFLDNFVRRLDDMKSGDLLVVPGGWVASKGGHAIMYVVERTGASEGRFTVCNTGQGVGAHPSTTKLAPKIKFKNSVIIERVPWERMSSPAFWMFVFSLKVFPDDRNTPEVFYGHLLPYLSRKPLAAAWKETLDDPACDWRTPQRSGTCYFRCVLEAMHYCYRRLGMSASAAKGVSTLFRYATLRLAVADLAAVKSINESDEKLIRVACRQLAYAAAKRGLSVAKLQRVRALVSSLDHLVDLKPNDDREERKPIDLGNGRAVYRPLPGFERLMRVGSPDIGPTKKKRDFVPLYFEKLPRPGEIRCADKAIEALRLCNDLCCLIANQESIQNAKALQAALIQSVLTEIVPIPRPPGASPAVRDRLDDQSGLCIWAAPMKYERQREVLDLVYRIALHFSAASFSMAATRSFDGVRIVVGACLFALLDVVVRKNASDEPSIVTQIFNDSKQPWTFAPDVSTFVRGTEALLATTPAVAIAQARLREYFETYQRDGKILFPWRQMQAGVKEMPGVGPGTIFQPGTESAFLAEMNRRLGRPLESDLIQEMVNDKGRAGALMWEYPILRYIRDTTLVLAFFMGPAKPSPKLAEYVQAGAELEWRPWKCGNKNCAYFLRAFSIAPLLAKSPRIESRARAARYLNRPVKTEDDVLYTRDLPTFEDELFGQDCELLMSYLTVPYLRIPLVLGFFSTEVRIRSLTVPALRELLEAVLFEPDRWISPNNQRALPSTVPAPAKQMGCYNGLLLNELSRSPEHITGSLIRFLQIAADSRDAKYNSKQAIVLYYAVRTVARIEGYMIFLLELARQFMWGSANPQLPLGPFARCLRCLGFDVQGAVRRRDGDTREVAALKRAHRQLRETIDDLGLHKTLGTWAAEAVAQRNWVAASRCHAHIMLVYGNLRTCDYDADPELARRFLESAFFVLVRHSFGIHEKDDLELEVPECEIFTVLHRQRMRIVEHIKAQASPSGVEIAYAPDSIAKTMERVVQNLESPEEETPAGDGTMNAAPEQDEGANSAAPVDEDPGVGSAADTKRGDSKGESARSSRKWTVGTTTDDALNGRFTAVHLGNGNDVVGEHEVVDLQAWQITVGSGTLKAVGKDVINHKDRDFESIFGRVSVQSAVLEEGEFCERLSIVGRPEANYEVEKWTAPQGPPAQHAVLKRVYSSKALAPHEKWLAEVFEPVVAMFQRQEAPPVSKWRMPRSLPQNAQTCVLSGMAGGPCPTLKEVIARRTGAVDVFNVTSIGRRAYRTLIYSTDIRTSLGSSHALMKYAMQPARGAPWLPTTRFEAGNPYTPIAYGKETSIVIRRIVGSGWERFIPSRALQGLLPTRLLEDYRFWQLDDDNLIGESKDSKAADYSLRVRLMRAVTGATDSKDASDEQGEVKLNSLFSARVERVPTRPDDPTLSRMLLLDPSHAAAESTLYSAVEALRRIEHASHILAWTKDVDVKDGGECSVAAIELPRLNLTFTIEDHGSGPRLYSLDLGMKFITNSRSELSDDLVRGIPNYVKLEDALSKTYVLVPSYRFVRPLVKTCPFSTQIVADPNDETWARNLDMDYYIYSIHVSKSFLFSSTLASSLYLVAILFAARDYKEVFELTDSLTTDVPLTEEEKQSLALLSTPGLLADKHPDAHACRLKLMLSMLDSGAEFGWDPTEEMAGYVSKRDHVSACCRLSGLQEKKVLKLCQGGETPLTLQNYAVYLNAMLAGRSSCSQSNANMKQSGNFVRVTRQAWTNDASKALSGSNASLSYKRVAPSNGAELIELANRLWVQKMDGSGEKKGFLFLYDLMTGGVRCSLAGKECGHGLGTLLFYLSHQKPKMAKLSYGKNVFYSVLSTLALLEGSQSRGRNWSAEAKTVEYVDKYNIKRQRIETFMGVLDAPPLFTRDQYKAQVKTYKPLKYYTTQDSLDRNAPVWQLLWRFGRWIKVGGKLARAFQYKPGDNYTQPGSATARVAASDREWITPQLIDCGASLSKLPVPLRLGGSADGKSTTVDEKSMRAFSTTPLSALVDFKKYTQRISPDSLPPDELPFGMGSDSRTQDHRAQKMLNRIAMDVKGYAKKQRARRPVRMAKLLRKHMEGFVRGKSTTAAVKLLKELRADLCAIRDRDRAVQVASVKEALRAANFVDVESAGGTGSASLASRLRFFLRRFSGQEVTMDVEYLIGSFISKLRDRDMVRINPYLTMSEIAGCMDNVIGVLLHTSRVALVNWTLEGLDSMLFKLRKCARPKGKRPPVEALVKEAESLCMKLTNSRHYFQAEQEPPSQVQMNSDDAYRAEVERREAGRMRLWFDPRFLVFEFIFAIQLRKKQVRLIRTFLEFESKGASRIEQMIMGAGKTTVVGPFLALACADGSRLVVQIVPLNLLEMSRGVMRERFSVIIKKPVFTLKFSRSSRPFNEQKEHYLQLHQRLQRCVDRRGVCCTSPTAVKSLMIKFIEHCNQVGENVKENQLARNCRDLALALNKTLALFARGAAIMDEVDMLLHPLRQELNFPIGDRNLIDFLNKGYRYRLPMFLIDAICYAQHGELSMVPSFVPSAEAKSLLERIRGIINEGVSDKHSAFQKSPHLVLLNRDFYMDRLRPALAEWLLLWMREEHFSGLTPEHTLAYIIEGPVKRKDVAAMVESDVKRPEHVQMLNLAFEWLNTLGPHCLSMINRVKYGILTRADQDRLRILYNDNGQTLSRRLCAVPFVGKDVPSRSSEFAHPDVTIGLTILAYRYDGLRPANVHEVVREIKLEMNAESGGRNLSETDAARRYVRWVQSAGARVRGVHKDRKFKAGSVVALRRVLKEGSPDGSIPADVTWDRWTIVRAVRNGKAFELKRVGPMNAFAPKGEAGRRTLPLVELRELTTVPPLHLVDLSNGDLRRVLETLLASLPHATDWFLDSLVFMRVLRAHSVKLSACAQAVGGSMLFRTRMGFSGTPSDLVPHNISCGFERGADAQMIANLCNPEVMTRVVDLPDGWGVDSLLEMIRTQDPPCHALIDTGALITGYSNEEVARLLLRGDGLRGMQGVVFLDQFDRKMVLVRSTGRVVKLSQSGISKARRFSFYDQVHTTGMDIKQFLSARAIITLGKDMSFRDYAQGAYRMRGIGKGQTFDIYVIPEVKQIIKRDIVSRPSVKVAATGARKRLVEISAWLVLNQLKMQKTQFQALCAQNIRNVFRKRAFDALRAGASEVPTRADVQLKEGKLSRSCAFLAHSLDLMREPIQFDIDKTVPKAPDILADLQREIKSRRDPFLLDDSGKEIAPARAVLDKVVSQLRSLKEAAEKRGDAEDSGAESKGIATEMVQEQEIEQESRREEEREREVEIEKYLELQYNRDNETQASWAWSRLANPANMGLDMKSMPRSAKAMPAWASKRGDGKSVELDSGRREEKEVPVQSHDFSPVIGGSVIDGKGQTIPTRERLGGGKYIALYFSAHWCGPCRAFTPKLRKTYEALRAAGKPFEVVFVSADRDETSFAKYFATMPWVAIPYDSKQKRAVMSEFKVRGFPTLIVLGPDGKTVSANARGAVSRDPEGKQFPWASDGGAAADAKRGPRIAIKRADGDNVIYKGSEFNIWNKPPVAFDQSIYISKNYYDKGWSLVGERRIKNVCIILEWIPDMRLVRKVGGDRRRSSRQRNAGIGAQRLTPQQRNKLRSAFEALDVDGSGKIGADEIGGLLRALNREVQPDEGKEAKDEAQRILSVADTDNDRQLDFNEVVRAIEHGVFYEADAGRFFVCISLAEAASIRRIMHARRERGLPVVGEPGEGGRRAPRVELAMWVMDFAVRDRGRRRQHGGMLLEATEGYCEPPRFQRDLMLQSLRYFNGDMFYSDYEIGLLIQGLRKNEVSRRKQFFIDVVGRRRRSRAQVQGTPIARLFTVPSEFHLMAQRAWFVRVRAAILRKQLLLNDAFKKFDHNEDGYLTSDELFSALLWLGIEVTPGEVLLFTETMDKDENGRIDKAEFMAVLEAKSDSDRNKEKAVLEDTKGQRIDLSKLAPKEIVASRTQASVRVQVGSRRWTSYAPAEGAAGLKLSAPRPAASGGETETVFFGHTSTPNRQLFYATLYGRAPARARLLHRFFPVPNGFSLVGKIGGARPAYLWRPVPPDKQYVALGLVATRTKAEPPCGAQTAPVRLIRRDLVDLSSATWEKIQAGASKFGLWRNTGTGLVRTTRDAKSPPDEPAYVPRRCNMTETVYVANQVGFALVAQQTAVKAKAALATDPALALKLFSEATELDEDRIVYREGVCEALCAMRDFEDALDSVWRIAAPDAMGPFDLDPTVDDGSDGVPETKLAASPEAWLLMSEALLGLGRAADARLASCKAVAQHKQSEVLRERSDVCQDWLDACVEYKFVMRGAKQLTLFKGDVPEAVEGGRRGTLRVLDDGSVESSRPIGPTFWAMKVGSWSAVIRGGATEWLFEFGNLEDKRRFLMQQVEPNVWSTSPAGGAAKASDPTFESGDTVATVDQKAALDEKTNEQKGALEEGAGEQKAAPDEKTAAAGSVPDEKKTDQNSASPGAGGAESKDAGAG